MKTKKQYISLKRTVLFYFVFILAASFNAQDKIIFTNGEELNVKFVEKTATEIKYKKLSNLDGPLVVVSRSSVFLIKFEDGTMDLFHAATTEPTYTPTVTSSTRPVDYDGIPQPVIADTNEFLNARSKKFSGPRVGFTFITNGTTSDKLHDLGKNPIVTQIGWQFEERIFTIDGGASGLIEFVPLIGGMEQGLFLPSANFLIGLRSGGKNSFEFAMGPNVSLTGLGMVFAAGTNFHSGKINFPVNLAVVPSVGSKKDVTDKNTGLSSTKYYQTGWRISLTIGFNSRKQ